MFKALTILCSIGLIVFTLSGCKPQIIREYSYIPCVVPDVPPAPEYIRVQFQQDEKGMIEFRSDNDAKGLLLNDLMNRTHIQELRTILQGLIEIKKEK